MTPERLIELRAMLDRIGDGSSMAIAKRELAAVLTLADLGLVVASAADGLLTDLRHVDRETVGFDADHESLPILRAAIGAAMKGGD